VDTLSHKLGSKIKGVITGFDRILFKGIVRPIMYAAGMASFLVARRILNKDFKEYAVSQSQAIVRSAEEFSHREFGAGVEYIPSLDTRKDTLARERQKERGITEGLVGIWSCVESCNTFRSKFNPTQTYPELSFERSKCKHLYFYFDDPVYGFMSVRMQTWAPYEIQVALNGREWLRRSLDKSGCRYLMNGNKFLHIEDYGLAQKLLDEQANTLFADVLDGFLPTVFPVMNDVLGKGLRYHWCFWQTEVAKDYIFGDRVELDVLTDDFMLHAMITGRGERILRYFGSPVRKDGQPHSMTNPEIISRAKQWYDGVRVRHWNGTNSVKFYNEHNVLRFEMTMNNPKMFKIHRHAENQDKSEAKRFMPMRKGIADTAARVEISKQVINRFTEHMAAVEQTTRFGDVLSQVTSPITGQGKRFRAIDVFGKDREILLAVANPAFDVHAITNRKLQEALCRAPWAKGMTGKQLSGRISRHLRLLREHGLIKKLPKQRKYVLTDKGRNLTAAVEAASATSVNELLKMAA